MKRIILLIVMVFMIGGCYDYQELNDMSIGSSLFVDYSNNQYKITLEVVRYEEDKEIEKKMLTGSGTNVQEAIQDIEDQSSKKIFLEHLELLGISENLAKMGIRPLIDFIIRDVHINNNFPIMIYKDMESVLEIETSDSYGSYYNGLLRNIYHNDDFYMIDMLEKSFIEEKFISLPYYEMDKIVYFHNDQLGMIVNNKIYQLLMISNSNCIFEKDNNVIEVYKNNTKYEVNKDKIILYLDLSGKVLEKDEDISITNLNHLFQNIIFQDIKDYLDKLNNYDILNLQELYYKNYRVKKEVPYDISIRFQINHEGAFYD